MSTIVTRSGKGSPLTHVEVDANFTNLNSDKAEKASNLSDLTSASTARTNLGLVIGTDVLSPSGSGASLTSLNATNISSGTLAAARLPALVGDASSSAGSSTLTLATVNSNTGSFGSATSIPVVTVNGKGLVTSVTTATVQASAGQVLQVVQSSISTTVYSTSSSYVVTGLIASITPKFSTSKILATLNGGVTTYQTGIIVSTQIYRQIASGSYVAIGGAESMSAQGVCFGIPHSISWLDSPATTSVVNYQPYFKGSDTSGAYFNINPTGVVTLTLMEIAG
jgi:hypothetical protein